MCVHNITVVARLCANFVPSSVDGALDPWLKAVWTEIMDKYPLPPGENVIPEDVLYPFLYINYLLAKSFPNVLNFIVRYYIAAHVPH